VPGIALLIAGANLLLLPFGASYVEHGVTVLRLLLVAALPQAMVSLYLSVERVRANVSRVLAVEATVVVLVTAGAVAGMHRLGLVGVGWAWLAAQSVVATLIAPALWRACHEPARPVDRARSAVRPLAVPS
jgi:O-antigen/teichoic acid export membrane protein